MGCGDCASLTVWYPSGVPGDIRPDTSSLRCTVMGVLPILLNAGVSSDSCRGESGLIIRFLVNILLTLTNACTIEDSGYLSRHASTTKSGPGMKFLWTSFGLSF